MRLPVAYSKSAMSSLDGYLELLPNGDVTFTKYKNQASGRVNILVWLVIMLVQLFMKDKVVLTFPKGSIVGGDFTQGEKGGFAGIGSKWSTLTLTATDGQVYTFYASHTEDENLFRQFAALATAPVVA